MQLGQHSASPRLLIAGFLLVTAVFFGGGGSPAPMPELVVELTALLAIAVWAWLAKHDRGYPRLATDRPLLALAGLFVLIPAAQLVPLPPAIWHGLPGREVERQALALVGRQNSWMPLSLSPPRTIASLLSLIPPVAMLFFVSRLTIGDRSKLLGVLGGLGLISAIVGVVQLASGHAHWLRFYQDTHYGFETGFQASRNAQVDVLLISMMAFAAWILLRGRNVKDAIIVIALLVFLLFSVIMTGSRAGIGLLAVPLLIAICVGLYRFYHNRRRLNIWSSVAAGLAVIAMLSVTAYFLRNNVRIESVVSRFGHDDLRPEIWKDTWYAIEQHWPVGTGLGTFQPVFNAAERLEIVNRGYANRAHNDYLEYLLEVGLVGVALLLVIFGALVFRLSSILLRSRSRTRRVHACCAGGSLLVIILHSVVDYPMRSMALAVIAGLMAAMLSHIGTINDLARAACPGRKKSEL